MARVASSTTPLPANQVYNSGPLYPDLADRVTGVVFADQAGTIYIEQSLDNGTNYDISTSYPVVANTGKGFSEEILLNTVRVRFVNGGTAQTAFRISARVASAGAR